jgi:hypothetical protein
MASGECKRNPAADLREALKPVQTTHLAAITDPKGGGKLMRGIRDYEGQPVTRAALELSTLLLLRPGELRHMVMGLDRLRWGHADRAARNDEAQHGRHGGWPAAVGAPGAPGPPPSSRTCSPHAARPLRLPLVLFAHSCLHWNKMRHIQHN